MKRNLAIVVIVVVLAIAILIFTTTKSTQGVPVVEAPIAPLAAPLGAGVPTKCTRKVTATRIDRETEELNNEGWGMDLRFKCDDTLVHIGSSTGGPGYKDVADFDGEGCPDEVNKSNWEGAYTYPDKFDISVGDCI